jgi:hypothetical protein
MKTGAFVLMDCLGFKGIWQRTDAASVLQSMKKVESQIPTFVRMAAAGARHLWEDIDATVQMLSDTVAISVSRKGPAPEDAENLGLLVNIASRIALGVILAFLDLRIPLLFRGCVTLGPHAVDGNFLIGQAVDEAAELHNEADGAFVWMTPPTAKVFLAAQEISDRAAPDNSFDGFDEFQSRINFVAGAPFWENVQAEINNLPPERRNQHIAWARTAMLGIKATDIYVFEYAMPLKDKRAVDVAILNPFAWALNDEQMQQVGSKCDAALQGNRLDIWIKRDNTIRFLNVAANQRVELLKRMHGLSTSAGSTEAG